MIKEFWQEKKEEKRKQKEYKKQNKKIPKTKEQKAYKVFGVFFVLFLIFGSFFYTCRDVGDIDNYTWDSIVGITEETKTLLKTPVEKKDLIFNEEINNTHWLSVQNKFDNAGFEIVINNQLSPELIAEAKLITEFGLNCSEFGSLSNKLIAMNLYEGDVKIIDTLIYIENEEVVIKNLFILNLSTVVMSGSLPTVYVTTMSTLEVLDYKLHMLNTEFQINKFSEEDNQKVLDVIKNSSILGLEFYTTKHVTSIVNSFASDIDAEIRLDNNEIKFVPKNK